MEGIKPTLHRWGLPRAMKFDNGQPFADTTANMIPPLALWLLGIGIELIYNRPNSPQANAKVERCQGTSARWAEPGQMASAAQLKQRLEEVCYDHVFRYPTRVCGGNTRIVCFPELLQNPKPFQPEQFDLDKVMAAYEKSDRLLIFNNNGSATIGWGNVKSVNEKIYARLSNVSLEITGLRVEILSANAAYVSCKWKQTQENDGKLENASGRMTLVYKLIGKEWKIVHRHTSPDNPDASRPLFPSERTN